MLLYRALVLSVFPAVIASCLDRPIGALPPVTTNLFVDEIPRDAVDKIDLLFMIDNSKSMADKQAILRLAVPDLVERLVNPGCIGEDGGVRAAPPPGEPCPAGERREFNPIDDINVGIISSSLGDGGANDACPARGENGSTEDRADMAHLVGSLERGAGLGANQHGFLEWREGVDAADFTRRFERLVESVGEKGCGFEASLESWYRFLVDPYPYRALTRVDCPGAAKATRGCAQFATEPDGGLALDEELIAQRAAFLRPDSLVAVIMLSDENDCSLRVGGRNWIVSAVNRTDAQRRRLTMFRGARVCEADPNHECCYSCGAEPPGGCAPDPSCAGDPESGLPPSRLREADDGTNLRCFDQKRRFGVDLLYPTARYVNALRERELCWGATDLALAGCPEENRVPNPLYAGGRDPSLVFLGGIVGVPWQAIASETGAGGQSLDAARELRFKTARELEADGVWSELVGPRPGNPWMVESQYPRPGIPSPNPVNGREYDTSASEATRDTPDDLEYACIFPLPEPIECGLKVESVDACDCFASDTDNPLCEEEPGRSPASTLQRWSKAYPGVRELEVLRGYGDNSIVASICARNVRREEQPDFGYRPAMAAIVDRLKEQLGDRCLPRSLRVDESGAVACTLVEAVPPSAAACQCDPSVARRRPSRELDADVRARLAKDENPICGADDPECMSPCLCEVLQVQEASPERAEEVLAACREEEQPSGAEGWCYVADTPEQRIGNPALVKDCPPTQRRKLRFVGAGIDRTSTTLVSCRGAAREELSQ